MPALAVDAREDVVQNPVEQREVDALDHAHIVERDVQAVAGQLAELAAVEPGQAERDQFVPINRVASRSRSARWGCCPIR